MLQKYLSQRQQVHVYTLNILTNSTLSERQLQGAHKSCPSVASNFHNRFLINSRFSSSDSWSIHVTLFHLTLIALLLDRWCSGILKKIEFVADQLGSQHFSLAPFPSSVFHHCLNNFSRVMICLQVCHERSRDFLGTHCIF